MELTRHYIEELVFDGGSVDVADPGSSSKNLFSKTIEIIPGSYGCYIYTDEDDLVCICQIASTDPSYREFVQKNIHNEALWEEVGIVGVDSGYAGFFDEKPKLLPDQWAMLLKWMEEDPDDLAFIHDFSDEENPVPNSGFWSVSGAGDDFYRIYALKYYDKIVALEIRFAEALDFVEF